MLKRIFPPAKPDKFAKLMIRALHATGAPGPYSYDSDNFTINIGDDSSNVMFLANAYDDYQNCPILKRKSVIQSYASNNSVMATLLPDTLEQARSSILPQLRDRCWAEFIDMTTEGRHAPTKTLPIADHLSISLVYDQPTGMTTISDDHLETWGIDFEQALAIARDNLWKISNEDFVVVRPGLYVSPWQDCYDGARLWLHDLVWQLDVKGRHVAMAPHRDYLLVTGSDDQAGLTRMAEIATPCLDDNRCISGIPVMLDGKDWVSPDQATIESLPLELRNVCTRAMAGLFSEQKGLLERYYAAREDPVLVGSTMLVNDKDTGRHFTLSVWGKGVDTLLPMTDRVAVASPPGEDPKRYCFDWDKVMAVAGDLMEPTDHYPKRYRVRDFPTEEQLRQLAEA